MGDERIRKLREFLQADPNDGFTLFALGMEAVGAERWSDALEMFDRLLAVDPAHVPAYHQKAQVLARLGRYRQARRTLLTALPHAATAGQFHAQDKMQQLFDQLPTTETEQD